MPESYTALIFFVILTCIFAPLTRECIETELNTLYTAELLKLKLRFSYLNGTEFRGY